MLFKPGSYTKYVTGSSDTLELAIFPVVTSSVSNLEVVTKSQEIDAVDSSFTVFYSQAVSIPSESISLERTTGFTTVKGNDDTDDLILPGTTLFTGGLTLETSHSILLNSTKLEITPESPLTVSGSYQYNVSNVEVNATNEITDVYDDSLSFTIKNTAQVFDINDIKLDNENFTTNGVTITATNTANEASISTDYDRSVYFYFPTSIESLQNFTMRQLVVTEENVAQNYIRSFSIVNNGNVNTSLYGTMKLAANEVVINDGMNRSVITGSAQDDSQAVYRLSNYQYISDNTTTAVNTISFEYAYETIAGDISTGEITIPVQ